MTDVSGLTWLPLLALLALIQKGCALTCYECFHMEIESNQDYLNELLSDGTIYDFACKDGGEDYLNSGPRSVACEWRDDYRWLYGSDMEDWYYPDYEGGSSGDYQDYLGDYYYNLHSRGSEVTCQRDVGQGSFEMFGMEITVKIWGRGCQALDAIHGPPVTGCTNDLDSYEHSMLYILNKETDGLFHLDGEICICQTDFCNSAAIMSLFPALLLFSLLATLFLS